MKTRILVFVVAVAAVAALLFGYVRMHREQAADEAADQPIAAASRVHRGADGETVITLDLKTQQLIGLQTATLSSATLPPTLQAYGRVLDSATLVALWNEVVAARAALQASRPEYERLHRLNEQDNASARALETAEAGMKRDQSALAAAEAQLVAASGRTVADADPVFFQSLGDQDSVLVRFDVPAGELPAETPLGARVMPPTGDQSLAVSFLGQAATTDPRMQSGGFLFLATNAPAWLTPGLVVAGFMQLPGHPLPGAVVPDDAVVRSDERAWVYVQTGSVEFSRREIALDHPVPGGWFVTDRLAPGDKVVVTGAQTLLSEERKSQIKLED